MYCDIPILILWRLINYNSKTFNYGIIFQLFVALLSLFLGSLMLWYSNTFLWVVLGIWFCDGWLIIFTICYFKTFIGGILFQLFLASLFLCKYDNMIYFIFACVICNFYEYHFTFLFGYPIRLLFLKACKK